MDTPFGDWWHEVIVLTPLAFDEGLKAVLSVRQQHTVVLNLSRMEPALAQRTADFVIGGVVALDGHHARLGENVFLFAPSLVAIKKLQNTTLSEQLGNEL